MYDSFHPRARAIARHVSSALAVASLAAFVACSDSSTAARGGRSQLSFITTSPTTFGAASLDRSPMIHGTDTLSLTQVTIVIEHAELKRQAANTCMGDNDANDDRSGGDSDHQGGQMEDCASVEVGPALVDLPLDSGLVSLPMDLLPAGTFQEFEFHITLVRLVGKFDGKAFDVTLPVNGRMEIPFSPALVVTDGTPTSITIDVPVTQWLTNGDGSLINPSLILSNPTLLAAVKAHIAATFHVFRDDNHDGRDDHDGDHGGH
jgi:hypothetical protein